MDILTKIQLFSQNKTKNLNEFFSHFFCKLMIFSYYCTFNQVFIQNIKRIIITSWSSNIYKNIMSIHHTYPNTRKAGNFLFALLLAFYWFLPFGQAQTTTPFPYSIEISTVAGNCYDDSRIIIDIKDQAGNVIPINPQTHNAQDISTYPLYNVQYHYRNVSAGTNIQYDDVNDIQVVAGTYCIGVSGYVPVTLPGGQTDYAPVDTTLCNIEVTAEYNHMEASILSTMARNNFENWWEPREFCGWRPSFECSDRGRIQLKLLKGKFPYKVLILDAFQDTIRQATFWQQQQSGQDSIYADYQDYYTFDNMPIGNYSIRVSDSCDYTLWLSIEIPSAEPYYYQRYSSNSPDCRDTSWISFNLSKYCYQTLHDYDAPYFDSILQYRFINPGGDTTVWSPIVTDRWSPTYNYLPDTLRQISLCDLYNDTILFQLRDLCHDTIYESKFFYTRDFAFEDQINPASMDVSTTPDTCVIRANSGTTTQTYDFIGRIYCWGCGWENNDIDWPTQIQSQLYYCPLSYTVYSAVDSSLITQEFGDSFDGLVAPITFWEDTIIPVHIEIKDARGCLLTERDEILAFDVEAMTDLSYPYHVRSYQDDCNWCWTCCDQRYLYIEQEIDISSFRQNMTVHLIESPLYNQFNFTAIYQNGIWTSTADDPSNNHTYIECINNENVWQVWVRDSVCLAPGRYTFVVNNSCGSDTVRYVFQYFNFYMDTVSFDAAPLYNTQQICDRLIVQPNLATTKYAYFINPEVDNNEPYIDYYSTDFYYRVIYGVPGGYNEYPSNGTSVFTVPGNYTIEYYTHSPSGCDYIFFWDTVEYVPIYIDMDYGYAILCDNLSNTGFVYAHAINGTEPYNYYLYNQPDLMGTIIGSDSLGRFQNVPMTAGEQISVMVEDACHNSFYINLTATPINQSALAWEFGDDVGNGHCEGDSVFLAALPFAFDVSYQWTGPNGFSSTERINQFMIPYEGESGFYTLEILNTGCTTSIKDSVYIAVIQAPRITILSDTTVCAGTGVTLEFQAQGTGIVNFDIMHDGAPASGSNSFSTTSGSSVYQYYPIESDNTFWAANISDERCAYHYLIDTVDVTIFNTASATAPTITTTDGYACYNHTASLRASSSIATPYYLWWYIDDRQSSLLQCDTISDPANYSTLYVDHVIGDTTVYVTVSSASNCASLYGTLYHVVNMQNGSTTLLRGEGARLYDSGGELSHYGDNENITHTFSCPGENQLDLVFNTINIAIGDTLYVYAGTTVSPSSLLAALTNISSTNNIVVHQSAVTFHFKSNWVNNREGWNIDIYTGIPMTEVSAHVSPLNYDTVSAVVCASENPYLTPYFPPLDISHEIEYIKDTLITADDGCQTDVHLHLIVNPVSHSFIQDSLMPCQLPHTWNNITFSDFGTQTATLTNIYGCDSLVTMTLLWAPPVDSTTVFDTIVENQLPYLINGLTFNGPGTQIAPLSTVDGCDSIVTMHLHVYYNVTADADSIICDNELPLVWNGATFTQSDTQSVVLTNIHGADSTLTMHVTVHPTHHTILKDTICQRTPYDNYGFILSESETATSGMNTFTRLLNNVFGCDSVVELQMLITPDITPNFYADPDKAILSENPNIQFINTTDISEIAQMNYYWIWDFGDDTGDTTTEYNTEHLYTQWGDYTVTLTLMVNDCESHFSSEVIIEADLKFPNVITPNGDGVNDVFIIKDLNPDRNNNLHIVDRWGKTVFDQKNYQTYMKDDIVYNAESGFGMGNLSEGVYFYTFYYEGAVRTLQFNGTITIIR